MGQSQTVNLALQGGRVGGGAVGGVPALVAAAPGAAVGFAVASAANKAGFQWYKKEDKEKIKAHPCALIGTGFGLDDEWVGILVGGAITGLPVFALVGIPCGVVGGCIGAMAGAAQDLTSGVQNLAQTLHGDTSDTTHGGVSDKSVGNGSQLRPEILPLLCALSVGQKLGRISDRSAKEAASAFAKKCGDGEDSSKLLQLAEIEGRKILSFVKLSETFPGEGTAAVKAAAEELVAAADADLLDAVWIVCGTKPLQEWAPEVRAALPSKVSDISPELLAQGLDIKYQKDKIAIANALQSHFPGGADHESYIARVGFFKDMLPRASFWKAHHLLMQGCKLPKEAVGDWEPSFSDLESADFKSFVVQFLETSFALHMASCGEVEASDSRCSRWRVSLPKDISLASEITSDFHGTKLEVVIKSVRNMGSPEYRLGDFASSFFGSGGTTMSPYVKVEVWPVWQGVHPQQTQALKGVSSDCADFEEQLDFHLHCTNSLALKAVNLRFLVYDARDMQASVRGDPLIGSSDLNLNEQHCIGQLETLNLGRDGCKDVQGVLEVQIRALVQP